MIPIVTPEEMAVVDAAACDPVEVLVARAGAAVARAAVELMGGMYGRRVVVVAGKGNNGADGRHAAGWLRRRGVRVTLIDAADAGRRHSPLPVCHLVIDAAYGTGFRGTWSATADHRRKGYRAPDPGQAPVLAVDIPSGVDGRTGEAGDGVLGARRTVTFAALKPGLLLGRGRTLAGQVTVSDIGLDAGPCAHAHLLTEADVAARLPPRPPETHKWRTAVWVVAGSPGMTGAAFLAARGAQRAGAGYVRLSSPAAGTDSGGEGAPVEAVRTALPAHHWADVVLGDLDRFHAVVVGPGLGRDPATTAEVRRLVDRSPVPVVVDGDGLAALGERPTGLVATTVVTPHDGEYARLTGHRPAADRLAAARQLAADSGATTLLKGSTTVVAEPGGEVLVSTTGGPALGTAGTGDVLSGVAGAMLAGGLPPALAAATAAYVHGRAGALGWPRGLVAGDLPDLLPAVFAQLLSHPVQPDHD